MAGIIAVCRYCKKEFRPKAMPGAIANHGRGKYCCKEHYWLDKKGKPTGRANFIAYGRDNPAWKGKGVGYISLHGWVKRYLGKADHCSFDSTHVSHHFEWANISGAYLRSLDDWAQLCIKCHRDYDMIRSGYSRFGKAVERA